MKTDKNIDELIKQALREDEKELYDNLGEQNLFQMVGGLFKGKLKWIMLWVNIVMVAWFVAFIFCLVRFLKAEDVEQMLLYGAGGFLSIMAVSLLKLFAWMQIDKNAVMREIKRLELQISLLSTKNS